MRDVPRGLGAWEPVAPPAVTGKAARDVTQPNILNVPGWLLSNIMRGIARGVSRLPANEADCKPTPAPAGGDPKGVRTVYLYGNHPNTTLDAEEDADTTPL